jgi:outer membrane protein assembly factor BamB
VTLSQQPRTHAPRFQRIASFCVCAALLGSLAVSGGCARKKPAPEIAQPLPLQSFARQWATDLQLKGDTLTGLHVREGAIYAQTRSGRVAALGRDTGTIQWWVKVKGGSTALHPPVVTDQRLAFKRSIHAAKYKEAARWEVVEVVPVVFPSATTLEIFDRSNGQHVTSVDLKSAIRSDAVGAGSTVYLGEAHKSGSRGAALDITQPYVSIRWEVMFPKGSVSASPVLHGDTVYFAGENGSVIAVAAADGRSLWSLPNGAFQTGAAIVADMGVDDECIYVASTDTKLYALNGRNGKIKWQYHSGAALRTGPAVTSDTVYQYVPSAGVVALAKAAGPQERHPLWVAEDSTQFLAQDDRNAYLRRRDGAIVARDKKTGEVKFTSLRKNNEVFATNISKEDGIVYAATKAGRVMAIRPILKPGIVGEVVQLDERPLNAAEMAAAR